MGPLACLFFLELPLERLDTELDRLPDQPVFAVGDLVNLVDHSRHEPAAERPSWTAAG